MTHTPSFLVWAIARHCPLRQIAHWEDAERTERLLRAARAYDEARVEGRILDGVVFASGAESAADVDQVRGFRIESALEVYGGCERLRAACADCPANALRGHHGRQVAGCFGMWPLPADLHAFYDQVDAALAEYHVPSKTKPGWFSLWMNSPLQGAVCDKLARVLTAPRIDDPASAAGAAELSIALAAAALHDLPLHVRLYPPGQVDGPWWNLVPHCGRCQAQWTGGSQCHVCGQTNHPASPKKRRARGQRPYYPLARLLGVQQTAELLARYDRQAWPGR